MKISIFFSILLLISACNLSEVGKDKNTMSRGEMSFQIDDAYFQYIESAQIVFEGINPSAHLKINRTTEFRAKRDLVLGKTGLIIVSSEFTNEEKEKYRKSLIEFRSFMVARDAVVLIVNKNNQDSIFSENEIEAIMTGKQKTWRSSKQDISVIFDGIQTANFNYFLEKYKLKAFPKNVYAAKNNADVIELVKNNENAIGVIGFNTISDVDDMNAKTYRSIVRICGISKGNSSNYFWPYQAYLPKKEYPFVKHMYCITKATPDGLEAGFANFLGSQNGQMLVDKCGMIPYLQHPRIINFKFE